MNTVKGKIGNKILDILHSDAGLYRLYIILGSLSLMSYRFFISEGNYDPIWLRGVLLSGLTIMSLASFFIRRTDAYIVTVAHVLFLLSSVWMGWLAWMNSLVSIYLIGYYITVFCVGISINRRSFYYLFAAIHFCMALATIPMMLKNGENPFILVGQLTIFLTAGYIFTWFRVSLKNKIRSQQKFLSDLFHKAPDAALLLDTETGKIFDYNEMAEKYFGLGREKDKAAGEITSWYLKNRTKFINSGGEFHFMINEEKPFWGDVALTDIKGTEYNHTLVRISDITQKKEIQESLNISHTILSQIDYLVIVANKEGEIIRISDSCEKFFGYKPSELMGNKWWEFKKRGSDNALDDREYIKECAVNPAAVINMQYEKRFTHKNGYEVWVLWKDTVTEDGLVIGIGMENTEARRNSIIRSMVFNIAEASSKATNPVEFYHSIHLEIQKVLDAQNFYIAVYNPDDDTIAFSYYSDNEDMNYKNRAKRVRKAGKGLTEYTIRNKHPLLIKKVDIQTLQLEGKLDLTGQVLPEVWLGIPIIAENEAIGLIAIQDYKNPEAYSEDDLSLLSFIASQVGQFVKKLENDEVVRISEEKFRTIFNQAGIGIALIGQNGSFLQVNQKLCEIFGYNMSELLKIKPSELVYTEDLELGNKELEQMLAGEIDHFPLQKRYLHKNGSLIYMNLNVSSFRDKDETEFIIGAYEDITEKHLVQQEIETLMHISSKINMTDSDGDILSGTLNYLINYFKWEHGEAWIAGNDDQPFMYYKIGGARPENDIIKTANWIWENISAGTPIYFSSGREEDSPLLIPNQQSIIALIITVNGQFGGALLMATSKPQPKQTAHEYLLETILSQLNTSFSRKMAEKARILSDSKYRSVAEATFDGIAIFDGDQFREMNTAFSKIFSLSSENPADFAQEQIFDDEQLRTWKRLVSGKSETALELRFSLENNDVRYLEAVSRQGTKERNNEVIVAVRDITQRKRAEISRETAKIDARFKAYVQYSSELIQIISEGGRILYTSPSIESISGKTQEEIIGTFFLDQFVMEQTDNEETLRQMLLEKGAAWKSRFEIASQSGETKILQANIINLMDDPLINGLFFSARDITNILEAEASLKQSEQKYRQLVETAREGIWVIDQDSITTFVNPRMAEMLEYSIDEMLGKPLFDFMDNEGVRVTNINIERRKKGISEQHDFELTTKSGKKIYTMMATSPVKDSNGKYIGALALVSDITTRKMAEMELESTLAKMKATFDATHDGILVVDNEGIVLDYNDNFVRLTTIPSEILESGLPDAGMEHLLKLMDDRESFASYLNSGAKEANADSDAVFRMKSGKMFEVYVKPFMMGDEALGRIWFFHDLTDLKRVEKALLENETKYRTLFSQANDAIMLMSNDHFIDCNEKAEEMFGLKKEYLVTKPPYELSPEFQPDGRSSYEKAMEKINAALDGNYQFFDWVHSRSDGTSFNAEVSLNRITIGDSVFIMAIVRDITDRIKAEKNLRESERKNKAIIDAIPDIMVRISSAGKVLDYKIDSNDVLVGSRGSIHKSKISEFLPSKLAEKIMKKTRNALETGESQQFETEILIKGISYDYEARLVVSGPEEVLLIIRNITDLKQTEKELIKRNFELDSFVYRASHDLKAPLNSLMGLISLLEMESMDENVHSYLGMMNKSVIKLDTFIHDLADFSRNTRLEIGKKEIDWESQVKEILENLLFMENSGRIRKEVNISASTPFFSDPIRIGIIFNNLISNAIKYQNLDSDDAFVRINISNNEKTGSIVIEDNGIGIEEEHLEKVYDLFFRASLQSYGSGMGMYITKNAVEKLGGIITLQSKAGKGTKFSITIPNLIKEVQEIIKS